MLKKNPKKSKEGLQFIFSSAIKTATTPALKAELENDYTARISPRLKKLNDYAALINSPLLNATANLNTKIAYTALASNVVDRLAKIQEFCDKPPRGTSEADLSEAKSMLFRLKTYQKEVSAFVGKEHFTITDSHEKPSEGQVIYDGYIRTQPLPAPNENQMGLEIVVNAHKLKTVKEKDRENVRKRIIAHEMQHAVQWNNGKLVFQTNTANPHRLFYDLTDEVDAIKQEYVLYGDDPRNTLFGGSVSINDITVENQSIIRAYNEISHLTMDLNINCTVDFIRVNNLDMFKIFIDFIAIGRTDNNAILRYSNSDYAGLELKLKDGSGWQAIAGLKFKSFLELLESNYPEIDTQLHYKK